MNVTNVSLLKTSVLDDHKKSLTPHLKKKHRISPMDIPKYKDEIDEFEQTNEDYIKDLNQKEKFMNQ
jgi:hypothetical protein